MQAPMASPRFARFGAKQANNRSRCSPARTLRCSSPNRPPHLWARGHAPRRNRHGARIERCSPSVRPPLPLIRRRLSCARAERGRQVDRPWRDSLFSRGGCQIKLDVDGIDSGPQADADAALRALVPMLTFDYLDGLFTSEADAKFHGLLEPLPHTAFTLPETVPRELVDRRPPERF